MAALSSSKLQELFETRWFVLDAVLGASYMKNIVYS